MDNVSGETDPRPLDAHIWEKEAYGFYIEPEWCSERLFEVEKFQGTVWDPACGTGRIIKSARQAGYVAVATDIIDRGYPDFNACVDFLSCESSRADNIVCNPPFDTCDQFVIRALHIAEGKVAMIWLARRLNAARWLINTPLARVYLLTPRPSMPPGQVILKGETPGGGSQDFVWLVFDRSHVGPPNLQWLYRYDNIPIESPVIELTEEPFIFDENES